MKNLYIIFHTAFIIFFLSNYLTAQVTGLSGWNIFLDPGHSQNENVGIYGYAEAKKVLRVGLNLRDLLLSNTDIDTVYMSRTNDQQVVSLTQRTDYANSVGAAWYHSIHSNAGSPSDNYTLLLWGQYRNGQEKIPNGGKAMSDIMIQLLTAGYRISTIGSIGDCSFYGCDFDGPYLHVNRESDMPSELSEAGFHTNPKQNQLNMNDRWKRLEAYIFYWTILKYFNINRPFAGITTGIISNIETAIPINGAVVSLNGQTDTTDTYQSLFHLYSTDPNQLHNGFYFFENLPAGTYPIIIQADGFDPYSSNVTISDTFFTFKDIKMVSNLPPYIISTSPAENDSLYPGVDKIGIVFSRPMDRASVESTLAISPSIIVSFVWSDGDRRVAINTDNLSFNTNYQVKISGSAKDKYNHLFDGDANGTGGDDFVLNFKTKVIDVLPPKLVFVYPSSNQSGVEQQPIINLNFNEKINTSTLSGKYKLIRNSDNSEVTVIPKHYVVGDSSIVNLFVKNPLAAGENYTVNLQPGIKDIFGNGTVSQFSSQFTAGNFQYSSVSNIDNFENGIGNWWSPQQSGSTIGIVSEATGVSNDAGYFNYILGGSKSLKLTYGWDSTASDWLIREYYSPSLPSFNSNNILQAYLFGDGSRNSFRLAVKDNTGSIEVSPWYNINWAGWKLINWDMTNDGTGSWIGNGVLDNPLKFDSFQLTHQPGSNTLGQIYFDDLRVVSKTTVGIDDQMNLGISSDYSLEQNYPNPFNPSTQIKFGIPEAGFVKLEVFNLLGQKVSTLINEEMNAGYHLINFSAKGESGKDLSSGIYIYSLSVNNFITSRKMILMK